MPRTSRAAVRTMAPVVAMMIWSRAAPPAGGELDTAAKSVDAIGLIPSDLEAVTVINTPSPINVTPSDVTLIVGASTGGTVKPFMASERLKVVEDEGGDRDEAGGAEGAENLLTIEQLAAETGQSVRNIRAHQARGLLPAPEV